MALTATIITSVEALRSIKDEWNALLERADGDTLFMTPAWTLTWLQVSTEPIDLFTIAVYDDAKLVGLVPFYLASLHILRFKRVRCLRITADLNTSSEYQDIVVDRAYEDAAIHLMARTLIEHRHLFSFVWVPFTDVQRGATDRFEQLFRLTNLRTRFRPFSFYTAELPRSKAAFDASLSPKQRNNIRRYKKRLAPSSVRLEDLAHTVPTEESFSTLTTLHEARWQEQGDIGAFRRKPAFAHFLRTFSASADGRRLLHIPTLFYADRAIAIRYGYTYKSVFYEIQTGFSTEFSGCGIVNIDLAIEHAIDHGFKAYDFLAYAGDYKQRFTAAPRSGRSLLAVANGAAGNLVFGANLWPTGRFLTQQTPVNHE